MMINLVIRFMIGCDYCAEWYHGSCVGVTAEDAKKIDAYRCPKCVPQSVDTPMYTDGKG